MVCRYFLLFLMSLERRAMLENISCCQWVPVRCSPSSIKDLRSQRMKWGEVILGDGFIDQCQIAVHSQQFYQWASRLTNWHKPDSPQGILSFYQLFSYLTCCSWCLVMVTVFPWHEGSQEVFHHTNIFTMVTATFASCVEWFWLSSGIRSGLGKEHT